VAVRSPFVFLGKNMNIIEQIENQLLPVAIAENVEIIDIEYVKENGQKILRIFIDSDNGVNLDLCARMSNLFGLKLDEEDLLKENYILEISSPGIDRILKKEKDFEKYKGFCIKATTNSAINGQKHFNGNLVAVSGGKIVIDDVTNRIVEIEISNILRANVNTDFNGGENVGKK
jgi:ribosome maturation factor RimP